MSTEEDKTETTVDKKIEEEDSSGSGSSSSSSSSEEGSRNKRRRKKKKKKRTGRSTKAKGKDSRRVTLSPEKVAEATQNREGESGTMNENEAAEEHIEENGGVTSGGDMGMESSSTDSSSESDESQESDLEAMTEEELREAVAKIECYQLS